MPAVSVLLTCFNHLAYLPAALDGVLKQTFRDLEIIAIDDGSTDGTREWLSEKAPILNSEIPNPSHSPTPDTQRPLHLIFNEKNLGTYASLNVALSKAKGDYIAILNDDDLWAPTKLEKQIALFEAHPRVGLVHTDGEFIDGHGKAIEGSPL